jgi:hypothetical protein
MALPTVVEPTAEKLDRSHGETWSRAELQLSGSMCPACLLELEEKLRAVPGIGFAHIERVAAEPKGANSATAAGESKPDPKVNSNQPARVAQAVIIFDSHCVSFDRLEHFIKHENYKPVTVKQVSLAPGKL